MRYEFAIATTPELEDPRVRQATQDYIASSGRSYPARTSSQPLYFESIDEQYRDQVQSVFEAAFADTVPLYMTKSWQKLDSYIQPNLVSVYNGQMTMEDQWPWLQELHRVMKSGAYALLTVHGELLRPFAPYDRIRFGGPVSRDRYVTPFRGG